MKNSTVSIIIPVYNAEKFIIPTLKSILNQTYSNFECLIVDDGSKDTSITLIQEYIKEDIRFQIFKKENEGVSITRNKGFEKAKGDYIIFLDSDDLWSEDFLEKSVSFLEQNRNYLGVASDVENIDAEGKSLNQYFKALTTREELLTFSENTQTCPSSYLYRRSILVQYQIQFSDILFNTADRYFLHQVLQQGKIGYYKGGVMYYRILENSMSRKISPTLVEDYINYIQLIRQNILLTPIEKKKYFSHFYYTTAAYSFHTRQYKRGLFFLIRSLFTNTSTAISLLINR
ncbi:glycosyltransferase family 2 protein [Flammeovirga aprica]|uniref:Glycosyltransferase family 2 protein n=1 Tax=Flammeovirga aprica JL-4 TaxID=694437 RepID=A0A7X9RTW9_9BACT|nr:glycosyltransferase family 2 protein [Flammeovirga aprica]NME68164.1 glycosyltransferase family 2 protein [Flammeovirga aprica JL-4]